MHWYRVSPALTAIAFGTFLIAASSQAGQYEGASTFSAAQAIQGVPLHGADYSISDRVPVENFQYVFSVNTKWGPFRVKGSDLLRVRLREITATEKLEEVNGAETAVKSAGSYAGWWRMGQDDMTGWEGDAASPAMPAWTGLVQELWVIHRAMDAEWIRFHHATSHP